MNTSTTKMALVAVGAALAAAGLLYQARANRRLRAEVTSLQGRLTETNHRAITNFRETKVATQPDQGEVERLRTEVARLSELPPPNETMTAWALRLANLKQRMAQDPGQNIPEMRYLNEEDWLDVTKRKLETEDDYRGAMAAVRAVAEGKFGQLQLQPALRNFLQANGNQFPTELAQLQSFFGEPVESEILERWAVMPANAVGNVRVGGDRMVSEKAPVDPEFDSRRIYGANGNGMTTWKAAAKMTGAAADMTAATARAN